MRFERSIPWIGYTATLVKESNRLPYKVTLDTNTHTQEFLAESLEYSGWTQDAEKPNIWAKTVTQASINTMQEEARAHLGALYRDNMFLICEMHRKAAELDGTYLPSEADAYEGSSETVKATPTETEVTIGDLTQAVSGEVVQVNQTEELPAQMDKPQSVQKIKPTLKLAANPKLSRAQKDRLNKLKPL